MHIYNNKSYYFPITTNELKCPQFIYFHVSYEFCLCRTKTKLVNSDIFYWNTKKTQSQRYIPDISLCYDFNIINLSLYYCNRSH